MKRPLKKSVGSKSDSSHKLAIGAGAGIATAAALGVAAAYFFSGKEGKQRRTKMKAWAVQAQKEVAKKIEMASKMSKEQYQQIVDEAVRRHGSLKKVDVGELMKVAKDMKGDWQQLQEHARKMAKMVGKKPATRTAKRAGAKTAAKRIAKKSAAKE